MQVLPVCSKRETLLCPPYRHWGIVELQEYAGIGIGDATTTPNLEAQGKFSKSSVRLLTA